MPAARLRFRAALLMLTWMGGGLSLVCGQTPAPAAAAPAFARCLQDLAAQAPQHGLSVDDFRRRTEGLTSDATVLAALDQQPEFTTPVWDYLSGLVDAERVADGRAAMRQWQGPLATIAQRYGVDPDTVVAVWGVESNYGRQRGNRPLLRSLATLSCEGRRQDFFRGELYASVRILQHGDIAPEQLNGSWAGAFGQTQFMPTTFERVAVDFDGDGRRDLVGNAADALASTAHYLALAGWQQGESWGLPVRLPPGYRPPATGRRETRHLSYWRQQGLKALDGSALPGGDRPAGLIQPAGPQGPNFLVFHNFNVIYSYNASISYTLAIALLSDQLRGDPAPRLNWPTDDPGTSRAERREIQQRLLALGYPLGPADGMVGDKTREAIQAEQRKHGLPADGRAGQRTLQLLRSVVPGAVPAAGGEGATARSPASAAGPK
ncbi:lytic murein transglycosylase [Frateuria aurantia]